jgi:hypothetical protein
MNYSGIDLICYMFNTTPELKYQQNFSYFQNDNPLLKKSIILTDLNMNAEPFVSSPQSSQSNVIAYFDKDIINNLINLNLQQTFFSFNENKKYESIE